MHAAIGKGIRAVTSVLVLGGTRSGKSEIAEALAAKCGEPVTYVATAAPRGADADFTARIDAHRARRPAAWTTIEEPVDLAGVLRRVHGTALVDSLGSWVAAAPEFEVATAALCDALRARAGDTVIVSEEVGLSVHPTTEAGRRFVDALGDCNRLVASVCDRVLLVVAGRTIELDAC